MQEDAARLAAQPCTFPPPLPEPLLQRTAHHGAVAAGSGTASPLASSRSSPNVAGPSRRRPAAVAAASSAGSAAPSSAYGSRPGSPGAEASAGASSCGSTGCTLLQPTASFVARVEETKSLKQLRLQAGLPSAFQPKVGAGRAAMAVQERHVGADRCSTHHTHPHPSPRNLPASTCCPCAVCRRPRCGPLPCPATSTPGATTRGSTPRRC